jgi:hypothetical protein
VLISWSAELSHRVALLLRESLLPEPFTLARWIDAV